MHFVYVLFSPSHNRFYVGESEFPDGRVIQHNSGHYKHASTSFTNDWELAFLISCDNRSDALKVEKHLKSSKSPTYLRRLISDNQSFEKFKSIIFTKYGIVIEWWGGPDASGEPATFLSDFNSILRQYYTLEFFKRVII